MAADRVQKIRFPIGLKLVSIITVLLLVSLSAITILVSIMVSQDLRINAEDSNFSINARSAVEAKNILDTRMSNAQFFFHLVSRYGSSDKIDETVAFFFSKNPDIAALIRSGEEPFVNQMFFLRNEADSGPAGSVFTLFDADRGGETVIADASPLFNIPLLALFFPLEGEDGAAAVLFSPEALAEALGTGANVTFMISGDDELLVYPGDAADINAASDPFVKAMRENPAPSLQTLYRDGTGREYLASYTKLDTGGAALITRIEYDVVFEGITATTRRNIYLTIAVLLLSVLFVWFFSRTISGPLKKLAAKARRIGEGDFEVNLEPRTSDEVGYLTGSFADMSKGLEQFGRFVNKSVALRAMKGELPLGGETKTVTVFFSDIRLFTAISEKLEPDEVVEFLNEYMSLMVECVNKTGGSVNKFIGDSIMGIWGAPDTLGSAARDALACVRSALMMRVALRKFNRGRGGDRKPVINTGCGINTGTVVAGQIGSTERMEYTVIGDAVNLASRTESLNKPLGTDILITEDTWKLVGGYLITEEMPPVTVKGKSKPVRLFAVINLKTEPGRRQPCPLTLAEVRADLGIKAPDLDKVDLDAEEKKYKL
ncbi:MAG: HAMP domain-containing protein [Treponema sp.]|nr:HAMP domain-containing protein [Treponema sp.]